MKKIITSFLALALMLVLGVPAFATDPPSITASGSVSDVSVTGSGFGAAVAAAVVLYDTDGTTALSFKTVSVSGGSFTTSFSGLSLTAGSSYTVKAANYDGGAWTSGTFTPAAAVSPISTWNITTKACEGGSLTASSTTALPGEIIKIAATPLLGFETSSVTADANGKEVNVTKGSDGTYSFTMPAANVSVSAAFTYKNPFGDVDSDSWYAEDVEYAYSHGLFIGTEDKTFSPQDGMTRGMLLTVLYRLEGSPKVTDKAGFTDVAVDSYYADAVNWAAANKIVEGYAGSYFYPETEITREQLATILYRYAQLKGYDVSKKDELTAFSDAADVSAYALDALKWAVGEKFILGDEGLLMPSAGAVRAQVAAILHRFCENVAK